VQNRESTADEPTLAASPQKVRAATRRKLEAWVAVHIGPSALAVKDAVDYYSFRIVSSATADFTGVQ
jgi:hypothetical protein